MGGCASRGWWGPVLELVRAQTQWRLTGTWVVAVIEVDRDDLASRDAAVGEIGVADLTASSHGAEMAGQSRARGTRAGPASAFPHPRFGIEFGVAARPCNDREAVAPFTCCGQTGRRVAPGKARAWQAGLRCQRLKASLIFAPACLRLPVACSRRPLACRRRLPVTRPAVFLAPPLAVSALCAIFLAMLTGLPFAGHPAGRAHRRCYPWRGRRRRAAG